MTFPQSVEMSVLKSYSVVVDKAAEVPDRLKSKAYSRMNIATAFSSQACHHCGRQIRGHKWFVSSAGRIVDCG